MPPIAPIKRRDLIHYLQYLGFEGPYSGKRHQYMLRGTCKVFIPNPHQRDIGKSLLLEILKQADVSREDWETL